MFTPILMVVGASLIFLGLIISLVTKQVASVFGIMTIGMVLFVIGFAVEAAFKAEFGVTLAAALVAFLLIKFALRRH